MSISDKYTVETITDVRPWTDNLFSFRTTRDRGTVNIAVVSG